MSVSEDKISRVFKKSMISNFERDLSKFSRGLYTVGLHIHGFPLSSDQF